MIRIGRYERTVEVKYWECVNEKINRKEQEEVLISCKKYLPPDFFSKSASFKELVLAPYEKIKAAYKYIERNKRNMENECFESGSNRKSVRTKNYNKLYRTYEKVCKKTVNGTKMNVFLVQQTGLTVCPYCNRDYINCRSKKHMGAQLDHFYPRSIYPIFSVCLYNLVPVCGNCNRIKCADTQEFASPFDEGIDWENDIRFSYVPLDISRKKIVIYAKEPIKRNVEAMHIETAYQIHEMEVNELLDKVEMYSRTQLEEFREVLGKVELTDYDIKKMVFGDEITEEHMKKKPLGRMLRDLEREFGIYE